MGSSSPASEQPTIPAVYVTMRDSDALTSAVAASGGGLVVEIYNRPRPSLNVSSFLIWVMGVATVGLGS
jgi:hypothetical protein